LRPEQLESILEIELGMVQQRVLETARGRFLFRVTPAAREFLLKEGTDMKYGARHLKRSIERHLVYPLASLLATEQVNLGDVLSVDWDEDGHRLVFLKEAEGALIPMPSPTVGLAADAARASSDGRSLAIPAATASADAGPGANASASRGHHSEKPDSDSRKK
jgi:ATP-dependent Clp protease ATP-binding subunit ClpB